MTSRRATPAREAPPDGPTSERRLLFVDDELGGETGIVRLLRRRGLSVLAASSFAGAAALLDSAVALHGYLLDVNLGEAAPLGGLALVVRAELRDPGAPIALLTGYDDPDYRRVAELSGARFIVKGDSPPLEAFLDELAAGAPAPAAGGGRPAARVRTAMMEVASRTARARALSDREAELLVLAASGVEVASLGRAMSADAAEVRAYVASILQKTGQPRLPQLLRRIMREVAETMTERAFG